MLHCQVCYVLVPAEPLEDLVRRQAFERAARALAGSPREAGSGEERAGEDLDDEETAARIEALAYDWIDRRGLWSQRVRPTPTECP